MPDAPNTVWELRQSGAPVTRQDGTWPRPFPWGPNTPGARAHGRTSARNPAGNKGAGIVQEEPGNRRGVSGRTEGKHVSVSIVCGRGLA
jgi:hypothetical protein